MNSGKINPTNTRGTLPMMEFVSMENFFKSGLIEDYTEDGWVRVESEWIPFSYFIKTQRKNNEHS